VKVRRRAYWITVRAILTALIPSYIRRVPPIKEWRARTETSSDALSPVQRR